MPLYTIYQQREPLYTGKGRTGEDEYRAVLLKVGELEARSGPHAIDLARELPIFKYALRNTLAAYPIVEESNPPVLEVRPRGRGLYRTRHNAPTASH